MNLKSSAEEPTIHIESLPVLLGYHFKEEDALIEKLHFTRKYTYFRTV